MTQCTPQDFPVEPAYLILSRRAWRIISILILAVIANNTALSGLTLKDKYLYTCKVIVTEAVCR